MNAAILPTALRLSARSRALEVDWPDGTTDALPFRFLRERCMCASCRSLRQKGLPIESADDVAVTEALPSGNHGVQLIFSDGHSRGIFPFAYLRDLSNQFSSQETR